MSIRPKHLAAPRIGIDGSSVVGPRTGIGHATAQLLAALADVWPESWPAARVLVNSRREPLPEGDAWLHSPRMDVVRRGIPGRILLRAWQHARWPPIERLMGPLDLIHSPASYIPPARHARRVITVHDLYFKHAPAEVDAFGGAYFEKTFARLAHVDHIITVSEFTRGELLRFYPALDPGRVTTIHHGFAASLFSPNTCIGDATLLERHRIEAPFLLCVATIEPRKNLLTLIEAYALMRMTLAERGAPAPRLVIAGGAGWGSVPLMKRIRELDLQDAAQPLGYVPAPELPALYRQALGFVFPSLHEGFGLPLLEAMACGCPVAASRAGALPEVAGDAAAWFDPRDARAMAATLAEFVSNETQREKLRDAGFQRARAFSWERAARETIEVYTRTMNGTSPHPIARLQ